MIRIDEILHPACIITGLSPSDKASVLRAVTDHLQQIGRLADSAEVHQLLMEREGLMTTGVRPGFAFPHVFNKQVDKSFLTVAAVDPPGVDYDSLDGTPVHFIFLLLGPPGNQSLHLRSLARVSHLTGQPEVLDLMRNAKSPDQLLEVLRDSELRLTARHESTP